MEGALAAGDHSHSLMAVGFAGEQAKRVSIEEGSLSLVQLH